ncbi:PRA1 family protein F2 [Platanthera guangdongensis]|uniref:PRA1 family protein n=1 Tax=Platanthera guangdongensis TaxID=2320717 RepID=A0ABR2M2F6_9ASPA
MTTYGTIPPPSLSPSPPDFISGAKQRGLSALATRRPWIQMAHDFSLPPTLDEAYLRIRTNSASFTVNYAIIVFLVAFLILLRTPISLTVFVSSLAAWLLLYFLRDRPVVFGGRTFDDSSVLAGLSFSTVLLWFLADATANIVASVVSGVFVVMVHAVFRNTDDLAVDEEAARAGSWHAVVGKSRSSRPLPSPAL